MGSPEETASELLNDGYEVEYVRDAIISDWGLSAREAQLVVRSVLKTKVRKKKPSTRLDINKETRRWN